MILRKIFRPERNNEEEYEIRSNKNLEELYNEPCIVGTLKSVRIGWARYICGIKVNVHKFTYAHNNFIVLSYIDFPFTFLYKNISRETIILKYIAVLKVHKS